MKVTLNLVPLIEQAVPQVWGDNERHFLYEFLERNTQPDQMVTVDIPISCNKRFKLTAATKKRGVNLKSNSAPEDSD